MDLLWRNFFNEKKYWERREIIMLVFKCVKYCCEFCGKMCGEVKGGKEVVFGEWGL